MNKNVLTNTPEKPKNIRPGRILGLGAIALTSLSAVALPAISESLDLNQVQNMIQIVDEYFTPVQKNLLGIWGVIIGVSTVLLPAIIVASLRNKK